MVETTANFLFKWHFSFLRVSCYLFFFGFFLVFFWVFLFIFLMEEYLDYFLEMLCRQLQVLFVTYPPPSIQHSYGSKAS